MWKGLYSPIIVYTNQPSVHHQKPDEKFARLQVYQPTNPIQGCYRDQTFDQHGYDLSTRHWFDVLSQPETHFSPIKICADNEGTPQGGSCAPSAQTRGKGMMVKNYWVVATVHFK